MIQKNWKIDEVSVPTLLETISRNYVLMALIVGALMLALGYMAGGMITSLANDPEIQSGPMSSLSAFAGIFSVYLPPVFAFSGAMSGYKLGIMNRIDMLERHLGNLKSSRVKRVDFAHVYKNETFSVNEFDPLGALVGGSLFGFVGAALYASASKDIPTGQTVYVRTDFTITYMDETKEELSVNNYMYALELIAIIKSQKY